MLSDVSRNLPQVSNFLRPDVFFFSVSLVGKFASLPPTIMEMILRASSPRATSLGARFYEVRCRFALSRPIIPLFSAPHMHVAWKQVFGREIASRTYRYFDFDRGLGYSTGADHRCTKLGEPAAWIPSCLHLPEPAHEGLVHPMVRVHCGISNSMSGVVEAPARSNTGCIL